MDRSSMLNPPIGATVVPYYGKIPHRTPILNLDIINCVLKSMKRKQDISLLMQTCRSIYDLGIPTLLHGCIPIYSLKSLESFHSFMFSNRNKSLNPFLFLHDLEITLGGENKTQRMMEWDLLKHAHYLRGLEMGFSDEFFESGPEPFGSVVDYPQLKTLCIRDAKLKVIDWIQSTKSPITNLVVDFSYMHLPPDILPALSIISNQLEILSLDDVEISRIAFQLPNVHSLEVVSREVTPAAILFSAFPNIQYLDVRMHPLDERDHPDDDEMHQTHNLNSAELYRLFRPLPSVKYLHAEPIDMYLSSLLFTAEEFHVLDFDHHSAPWLLLLLPQIRTSSIVFQLDVGYVGRRSLHTLESMLLGLSNITVLKKVIMDLGLSRAPGIVQSLVVCVYLGYLNLVHSVYMYYRNACQTL